MLSRLITSVFLAGALLSSIQAGQIRVVLESDALISPDIPTGFVLPDGRWQTHNRLVQACLDAQWFDQMVYSPETGACRGLDKSRDSAVYSGLLPADGKIHVIDLVTRQSCTPGTCEVILSASGRRLDDMPPLIFHDRFETANR